MASNINVMLNGAAIQVLDLTTNLFRINSNVGQITLAATASFYDAYLQVATTPGTTLALPATPSYVVYVNNLSSLYTLTVQLTVNGGTQISVGNSPVLPPGSVFMYWSSTESYGGGISGVTLIGSALCPAEVLLAA